MSDRYKPLFATVVGPWHRWFAWRPVETADRGYRWLCVVNRRRCQFKLTLSPYGGDQFFQYACDLGDATPPSLDRSARAERMIAQIRAADTEDRRGDAVCSAVMDLLAHELTQDALATDPYFGKK